ncbi:MAG: 50S ribosomal protein L24 [Bdellovibrio sp.]|nr:50S ribosomal protein L24 [Bdellovibrio sp.]
MCQGKLSLRKNDQVQVIAGREKGKTGKILHVDSKSGRVTVEKTNMVKRHTRPTAKSAGGIVEQELPIHYSNVLLLCAKCNKGVRHGVKFVEKQKKTADSKKEVRKVKIRVCKRCNESLETA